MTKRETVTLFVKALQRGEVKEGDDIYDTFHDYQVFIGVKPNKIQSGYNLKKLMKDAK